MPPTTSTPTVNKDDNSSMRRIAVLLKPHAGKLTSTVFLLIGLTGVNMLFPTFIKLLIDDVFGKENWTILWFIFGGILGVYLARNLLYFFAKTHAMTAGENVCFSLRNRLFERLQQMNMQFYRQHKPGQVSSRVMDDTFVIQSFIQDELPKLMQATFLFVGLVAVLYAVNWQLALASTIVLPLHFAAFRWFKRPIKEASRSAQEQIAVVHGNLIEKFLAIEVVKGFTGEQRESEAFEQATDLSRQSQLKSKTYHMLQKIVGDLLVGVGTIGLIGVGAFQVIGVKTMQPGAFMMFFGYVGMLYPTVLELTSGFAKLTKSTASIDRVFELLETGQRDVTVETLKANRPQIRGLLQFKAVCFSYDDGMPVLKNVDLTIKPGQVCALVGPSGAGKSTLVSLIPRFADPDLGEILLDGTDIHKIDARYLRKHVGLAFQECILFNRSVLENLRYAKPDATMAQIVAVAKPTGAHELIQKLPDGYHTVLGENGVALSRGEKQRISLTRALLKNPRILVMDESTSSLDASSEARVIPAVLEVMKDRTVLMITHRAELLAYADTVVVIDDGRVTFQGSPQQVDMTRVFGQRVDSSDTVLRRGLGPTVNLLLMAITLTLAMLSPAMGQGAVKIATPATKPSVNPSAQSASVVVPVAPAAIAPAPAADNGPLGVFTALGGFNELEAADLLDVVTQRIITELGYQATSVKPQFKVPSAPKGIQNLTHLVRRVDGDTRLFALGYQPFRSQPLHLWVQGITEQGKTNADLSKVQTIIDDARKNLEKQGDSLTVGDLAVMTVDLSYIETDRCLAILKALGYQCIEYVKGRDSVGGMKIFEPTAKVDLKALPVVMQVPASNSTALVGGREVRGGKFGLVMNTANPLTDHTSASPVMRLMVLYHPNYPEQYSRVVNRIKTSIDVPARKVLIEAMVLEISQIGLEKLGVQWELESPAANLQSLRIGRLPDLSARNNEFPTFDASLRNVFGEFGVKIEALIRSGDAKIKSRPSVLTLDNRQASIRVGEDIPVATSIQGLTSSDKLQFTFNYIPIGILLNVRPRVSENGEEVTMQIDAVVSAQVPGQDLVIFDNNPDPTRQQELARAPRISTRRVQTYSRIDNNTPFIIGGLVSENETRREDKVPFLGDLPLIGGAFRSSQTDTLKREVIIVITPYVLPENQVVGRNLPKDEDAFDSFGNRLFRDAYRIRAEDVFDLNFLLGNRQLQHIAALTRQIISRNADLGKQYPFDRFANGRIPGEHILVYRQMYEVIKRKGLDRAVDLRRLIFLEQREGHNSDMGVSFMWQALAKAVGVSSSRKNPARENDVMRALHAKRKTFALTFTMRENELAPEEILSQPTPQVQLLDCPDGHTWSKLLWQLNQPDENGRQRHTLLIHDLKDLIRLKRAIVLKRTVELNASRRSLTLKNFSIGRLLLMPTVKADKVYLIDGQTAKYFFMTEQYYPAVMTELTRDIEAVRAALKDPDTRSLLDHPKRRLDIIEWQPGR